MLWTAPSTLHGFTIAGDDRTFLPAEALVSGDKIFVSNSTVARLVDVRSAGANNPDGNLHNQEHLPAPPFRTEGWSPPRLVHDEKHLPPR